MPTGAPVFYKFQVENTGDVPLSTVAVSDPALTPSCVYDGGTGLGKWTNPVNPLPVAVAANELHISECVVAGGTATLNSFTNTATGTGTYSSTPYSASDSAAYQRTALSIEKNVTESYFAGEGNLLHYTFRVTNTGTAALRAPVTVFDDKTTNETCAAVSSTGDGDDWLDAGESLNFTCTATYTVTAADAIAGVITNIASASADGVNSGTATKTINKVNANFGHLPTGPSGTAFTGMNLWNDGGARHISGGSYFGASVTNATDGINTTSYTPKASDDGVTYTPSFTWTAGGNGSVDMRITCAANPCYVNAWIDWNKDGDFNDSGERIFSNLALNNGVAPQTVTFPIPSGITLDGTFYSRFRLYQGPSAPSSPSANGEAGIGEIEDPFFEFSGGGGVPTPVTLAFFRASRQSGGTVFQWSTATEIGNLGFNLYVEQNGKRLKANSELIASHLVDSLNRLDYSYSSPVTGDFFFIEEVSVRGVARQYGPFAVDKEYGGLVQEEKIDREEIQKEHAAKFAERQQAIKKEIRIPPAAYENRFSDTPSFLLTTTLNLEVRNTGIHRVTYETLKAAGLDLAGVPTPKIALLSQGQEVPIYVSTGQGSGGKFGPGGYIEFHGVALDTLYTDKNIYTLQVNTSASSQILSISAGPANGQTPPAFFMDTVTVNRQRVYGGDYAPGTDAWYDTALLVYKVQKSWEFSFDAYALANVAEPSTFKFTVWGVTDFSGIDPDHHVVASVNGLSVADATFNGLVEKTFTANLPAKTIRSAGNVLRVTLPGDTAAMGDLVNFDRLSLTYPRTFTAKDGRLSFTAAGRVFRVANLPSNDVVVYRLGDDRPVRLEKVKIEQEGGAYAATFAGSNDPATYVVTSAASLYTPVLVAARAVVDLNQTAEYLVISHPSFISGIQPLVNARQAQGLTVNVVDVFDIYSQYSHGILDPNAIRDYISHAARKLGTKSVLLVGGDSYDYRNYVGGGSLSFIPSLYVSTGSTAKSVPVDPLFGDVDRDNIPDVAVGRFPVRTSSELSLLLNKTFAYGSKTYGQTAVFTSDKADGLISFKAITNAMAESLPGGWSVEKIHLDDTAVGPARTSLLNAMNRGTSVVTFTGHSGPSYWTFNNLFTTTHAASLTNAGRPFVAVQWGCWNTYFVDPLNNYLVQSLLFSGDRGAAAVLGASTLTDSSSEAKLGKLLSERLAIPGKTIGEALQEAKRELAKTEPDLLDVLLGWTLMGDPGLVIQP